MEESRTLDEPRAGPGQQLPRVTLIYSTRVWKEVTLFSLREDTKYLVNICETMEKHSEKCLFFTNAMHYVMYLKSYLFESRSQ
jgi:hypothetical protein